MMIACLQQFKKVQELRAKSNLCNGGTTDPPASAVFPVPRSGLTISARPDSAPTLHRRYYRDAALPSRERSPSKLRHASAWLPPRVTRLERETQDLLTACRKAGRDKGDVTRWHNEQSRRGRTTEEPPPCERGESKGRSENSNTYGSDWGKSGFSTCFQWFLKSRRQPSLPYLSNERSTPKGMGGA